MISHEQDSVRLTPNKNYGQIWLLTFRDHRSEEHTVVCRLVGDRFLSVVSKQLHPAASVTTLPKEGHGCADQPQVESSL